MKTLVQLVEATKCRKGKADGTTKKGAFWLAAEIMTRSFGGDGIGQSAADMDYSLQLRHFRNGAVTTVMHYHAWHQNSGTVHAYHPANVGDCKTVEEVIVALKGMKVGSGYYPENVYSDRFEEKLTAALVAIGMSEMEPAPDEEDPETAS